MIKSTVLTLVIIFALGVGLFYGGDYAISHIVKSLGSAMGFDWDYGMDMGAWAYAMNFIITGLLGWFLFRTISVLVLWMFADDIVEAIEWQHYSHAALTANKPSWFKSLLVGLRALLRAVIYNLLALPLYIIALFTVVGAPIIFLIVNGYLLGRELEEMVALRHAASPLNKPERWTLGKGERFFLGFGMNVAMMIPFAQFLVPVIATSMTTHMMHRNENG